MRLRRDVVDLWSPPREYWRAKVVHRPWGGAPWVEYGPTRTDPEQAWRDSVLLRYGRQPGSGGSYDEASYERVLA